MCRKHLETAAKYQRERSKMMKALRRCNICGRKLPIGRNKYCLLCKPTLDGKTLVQKRLARQRTDEGLAARLQKRRLEQNVAIEMVLSKIANARRAAIVKMRCGINNERDCPLKEVGKFFGISRERVRQIEKAVLGVSIHKLRIDERVELQESRCAQNTQSKVRTSKTTVSLRAISALA
jgi:ribosomal protein S14